MNLFWTLVGPTFPGKHIKILGKWAPQGFEKGSNFELVWMCWNLVLGHDSLILLLVVYACLLNSNAFLYLYQCLFSQPHSQLILMFKIFDIFPCSLTRCSYICNMWLILSQFLFLLFLYIRYLAAISITFCILPCHTPTLSLQCNQPVGLANLN